MVRQRGLQRGYARTPDSPQDCTRKLKEERHSPLPDAGNGIRGEGLFLFDLIGSKAVFLSHISAVCA